MTSTDSSTLQRTVMRRIRFIRAVRPFMSNLALALALLGVSLYFLGREVFVAQVFRNLAGIYDPVAALRFFETAFLNTELAVQLLSVCALLGFAWLMRESLKALSTMGYSAA